MGWHPGSRAVGGVFQARSCSWVAGVIGMLALAGGCFRPVLPELELERPAPPATTFELEPYLRATRYGEWVYRRTELGTADDASATRYVRRVTADRLSEGILSGRTLPPLSDYIQGGAGDQTTTRPAEPPPLSQREAPQLFELAEPMTPIPVELTADHPIATTTELRYYDRRGRLKTTGTLTRRVQLEGTQEVETPAGHFKDCLRLRLDLRIELPFGPTIDWNSYFWLSREAGEVRRIEEFSGTFWIFGFGSAHEYQLVSYTRGEPPAEPGVVAPKWARGLITIDRPIPRPRVSGVMIDFAQSRPAP